MGKEYRVFGPPGTGKTTFLKKWIENKALSNPFHDVLVTSFTKAAAVNLTERVNLEHIKNIRIGTLHSICFGILTDENGSPPKIAEQSKYICEWNRYASQYKISSNDNMLSDPGGESATINDNRGDEKLNQYNILRNRLIPKEEYKDSLRTFVDKFEDWKARNELFDYTDLLLLVYNNFDYPPNIPKIMFVDEAQDMTPLQLAIIRKWGEYIEKVVFAADDDQAIYAFAGVTPNAFLFPPIPDEDKYFLRKSYRVQKNILEYSKKIIKKVKVREPKEYEPYGDEGRIMKKNATYKNPQPLIKEFEKDLAEGKSVMVLASCSYMLHQIINELRDIGLLFYNPYRLTNGLWNPVKKQSVISWNSFFNGNSREWTKFFKKRIFKEKVPEDFSMDELIGNELKKYKNTVQLLYKAYKKQKTIQEDSLPNYEPKIIIGTIHSVKGGEADKVYIFPDISYQAYVGATKSREQRDSLRRVFYVAVTRSKGDVVLCRPATNYFMRF